MIYESLAIAELHSFSLLYMLCDLADWQVPNWLTYDFPPAVKAKVNRLWRGGEWHGQAQKW